MNDSTSDSEVYTIDEMQKLLKVSRYAVYKATYNGTLPSVRIGKQIRYSKAAIDKWLRGESCQP
jgi:excisionase family DNA binding protein